MKNTLCISIAVASFLAATSGITKDLAVSDLEQTRSGIVIQNYFESEQTAEASLAPVPDLRPGMFAITGVSSATDGSDYILIDGSIDPSLPVSGIDINGYSATASAVGSFQVSMPESTYYNVNIYYTNGTSSSLVYTAPTVAVDRAIQVLVGESLTDELGPVAGRLLENLDIAKVLGISAEECLVDTLWLRGCDLYIRQIRLEGRPDIRIQFSEGYGGELNVNVTTYLPQVIMESKIKRQFWFGYRSTKITAKNVRLHTQIGLQATRNQSIRLILDEPSDVHLNIGSMNVESNALLAYQIPLYKDLIAGVLNHHFVAVAGPYLKKLPVPAIPLNLAMDIDEDEVTDAEFVIDMHADELGVMGSADGRAVLSGHIRAREVAAGRRVIGTRRIGGLLPTPEVLESPTDVRTDIAIDLVNQVLTAVYQSGVDQKLGISLAMDDLGFFGAVLAYLGYPSNSLVDVSFSFGSAPELQLHSDGLYPLGLMMALPDMRMAMSVVNESGNEVVLDFESDVLLSTSLGAETDGQLLIELGDLLSLGQISVNGGTLSNIIPPELMAELVAQSLPTFVADLEPAINELLNTPRLELDIGQMLSDWLSADFPSVTASGHVTEAGSMGDSYISIGAAVDFE